MIRIAPTAAAVVLALGVAARPAAGAEQTLGDLAAHERRGRSIVLTDAAGARLRLTAYGDHVVRVQAARAGETLSTDDANDIVARHDVGGRLELDDRGDHLRIAAAAPDGLVMRVGKRPLRIEWSQRGRETPFTRDAPGAFWDGERVGWRFAHAPGERFGGLGHGYLGRVERLDLTGARVTRNYGTAGGQQAPLIVPFYLSRRGYGVLLASTFENAFRLGEDGVHEAALAGAKARLDLYVILGPALTDVIDRYTALTGRPRLPKLAMLGLALSDKTHPDTSDAGWWQRAVARHRAAGFPLDHLVNDNRWRAGGGQRCVSRFELDRERYPDPAAYARWLRREGLVATLDFNRCIANQCDGWDPGFQLPDTTGIDFPDAAPDLTNERFCRWWWELMWRKALDPALDFSGDALWIDEFDQMFSAPPDMILADGRRWRDARNGWFGLIARALGRDGWDLAMGPRERPFIWVRGMTAGGQRHATLWSGDISPTFDEMKLQIRGMLAAGISGFPFWGHDAGGFWGEGIDEESFDVIYRQWSMALGSFTPFWKPHGTRHSRWPVDRSPAAQEAASRAGELRYRLLPYTYTHAAGAARAGLPIARPMLLLHPELDAAWERDLQFYWGDALLVVPDASPGGGTVEAWLPPGRWYDWWTDAPHEAAGPDGAVVALPAPTGRLPLLARAGAIIPMAPYALSTAFLRRDRLEVHVFAGADGAFSLYEDDGVSERHLTEGAFRTTDLRWDDAARALSVEPARGRFEGAVASRRLHVVVHGLTRPFAPAVDGEPLPIFAMARDARAAGRGAAWEGGRLTIVAGERAVGRAVTIGPSGTDAHRRTASPPAATAGADGAVELGAEHFAAAAAALDHRWREVTWPRGWTGDGAVVAWPRVGERAAAGEGPRLDYRIALPAPGSWRVSLRARAGWRRAGQVHVALDGGPPRPIAIAGRDAWAWHDAAPSGEPVMLQAEGTLPHRLSIFMGEDGVTLDAIRLEPAETTAAPAPRPRASEATLFAALAAAVGALIAFGALGRR